MAYKRHKRRGQKKHHHRRRRSVGAMSLAPTSPLVKYGPIAGGFLLAKQINTALDGIAPAAMKAKPDYEKLAAALQVGIGALLIFSKGKRSLIKSILGGLALGSGAKRGVDAFKKVAGLGSYGAVQVVSGYGATPAISRRRLNGYTPNSALTGYTPNTNLAAVKPVHQQVMGNAGSESYGKGGYME